MATFIALYLTFLAGCAVGVWMMSGNIPVMEDRGDAPVRICVPDDDCIWAGSNSGYPTVAEAEALHGAQGTLPVELAEHATRGLK